MGSKPVHPFVTFLHAQRSERNLSQRDLWRAGGPRQQAQSHMENGVWTPTLSTLEKYAMPLGFRLALVDGKGNVYELTDMD